MTLSVVLAVYIVINKIDKKFYLQINDRVLPVKWRL